MRLRTRLTLTVALFTILGLAIGGAVINSVLRDRLTAQLDLQLAEAQPMISNRLELESHVGSGPGGPGVGRGRVSFPQGTYAAILDSNGQVVREVQFLFDPTAHGSPPAIDSELLNTVRKDGEAIATVPARNGEYSYRVRLTQTTTGTLAIAIPLTGLDDTMSLLTAVELGVGAAVILAVSALTYVAVRAETRPLDRMTRTAEAIAAGDFSRRITAAPGDTEVGRLAAALDAMLSRIDSALASRQAAADRLRVFVADASHELRTPLTSIRGYSELFNRTELTADERVTAMRRIEQEATRMSGLVDDLLTLARLDENPTPTRQSVAVGALVEDAVTDARAADPNREVQGLVDGSPIVIGDPDQLRAVIANLWRNALVHTPAGTPVELRARAEGDRVVLEVIDHGPGIPVDQRDLVFERLWRADDSRVRDSGGAGLGLAITAHVVQLHGGTIKVDGTEGGGATFRIELPAAHADGAS